MEQPISPWARQRFGQRALHVRRGVTDALQGALTDAQNAQKESKSKHRYPFGSALMTRRYERLVEQFDEMEGVEVIKPQGSAHSLVVLNNNLLFPFRYAQDGTTPIKEAKISDRKVSALIAELFQHYGPEPSHDEPPLPLFDTPDDDPELLAFRPALTRLPADTKLVLIAYACNDRAGLFNAWWGEAELRDSAGHLRWLPDKHEQLPLTVPPPGGEGRDPGFPGPLPGPRPTGSTGPAGAGNPRFDAGAMPDVPLTTRPPLERRNSDLYPRTAEPTPETPNTDEQTR